MRQSRKVLRTVILILAIALTGALAAIAVLVLSNGGDGQQLDLENVYDLPNDELPPVKFEGGFVKYKNDAGEWLELVSIQELFEVYGGVIPSPTAAATQTPVLTETPDASATPSESPAASPTPTPTVNSTDTPKPTAKATATPKPTTKATVKPTVKPTTKATATPKPTTSASNTVKPTTAVTNTPKPTTTVTSTPKPTVNPTPTPTQPPVVTPSSTPTGGDGGDITNPTSSPGDWGSDME